MATKVVVEYVGPINREREGYSDAEAQAIMTEICERIANGETLIAICKAEHLPAMSTISSWLMADRLGFGGKYACAREAQAHLEAEQIRAIADECPANADDIAKARLQIDARKWRAERLNRRVYGNSTKHEHELTVHPAYGEERLPGSLEWLRGRLDSGRDSSRREPCDSGMGEE